MHFKRINVMVGKKENKKEFIQYPITRTVFGDQCS